VPEPVRAVLDVVAAVLGRYFAAVQWIVIGWFGLYALYWSAILVCTAWTLAARRAPAEVPLRDPVRERWDEVNGRLWVQHSWWDSCESSPVRALELPALRDPDEPATARFLDALAIADRWRNIGCRDVAIVGRFERAVDRAERARYAAEDSAYNVGLSRLAPEHRPIVREVIDLLAGASDPLCAGSPAAERALAVLDDLERAGGPVLPGCTRDCLEMDAVGFVADGGP
jgi:hypothetical protein